MKFSKDSLLVDIGGQTLDAATLGFTFVLNGMAVLQDAGLDSLKARLYGFIDAVDLADIHKFTHHTGS